MTVHVMLNLETLGDGHNASILSIGAVKFDPNSEEIYEKFHVAIDPQTCEAYGLKIDASTVIWWLHPDRSEARNQLLSHQRVDLATALAGFAQWFGPTSLSVWSDGMNAILCNAYVVTGLECPWKLEHERCYRTLSSISTFDRTTLKHDALEDAITQVQHFQRISWNLRQIA